MSVEQVYIALWITPEDQKPKMECFSDEGECTAFIERLRKAYELLDLSWNDNIVSYSRKVNL